MRKTWTSEELIEKFGDEFNEFAREEVMEHQSDYLDGYTTRTEEDVDEVIEFNKEKILDLFIDEKGLKLEGRLIDDDTCVLCGAYVEEGSHVCKACKESSNRK